MSDKPAPAAAEKKPAAAPADDKKGGGKPAVEGKGKRSANGGLLAKTPVLIGAVMAAEAIILFAGFKVLGGGPKNAGADVALVKDGEHGEGKGDGKGEAGHGGKGDAVELPVCELRAPNKLSGRTFLYDVSLFATAKPEQAEKLKGLLSARDALIKDRLRTIIAELDPEKLSGATEPGLETLRRQVKFQLDQIVGEGLVDEVLVPRCMPFRTDY